MSKHVLEPEAQAFAEATAAPPFLYELGPEGAQGPGRRAGRARRQADR